MVRKAKSRWEEEGRKHCWEVIEDVFQADEWGIAASGTRQRCRVCKIDDAVSGALFMANRG